MKKRLFLFVAIVAIVACVFAISVSADTLVPSDANNYGTLSVIDGIPEPTVIDKNAKAVIVANEKYYTIPTYYLIADNSEFTWSVHANLQSALGLGSDARSYLIRVEIPEGIKTSYESSNGGKKFEDASKLIEASFPTSMELIGEFFFNRCYALTTVTGLENTKVTKIYRNTFNNTAITSVTMPSTVASIGDYAFSSTKITSIAIPDNVVTIGDHAFASCKSLATVTITENSKLKNFTGSYQFEQTLISSFYFPSTLETLGDIGLFYKCSSLVTLTNFENTKLETIPERAFGYGPAFTSISFPKGLKTIGTNAFNGHKISGDIILPNTVTAIGDHAFAGSYTQMGKLVLGGGLTTITGTYTFEKAKFSSIYIPATLTSLPQGAFNETNGSGAVYYFTGSLSQLETLISNTNTSSNGNFLNAQIVTLDEFKQIADASNKNYIVYGLNPCDTFYNGVDLVENVADCTQGGVCSRVGCGRTLEKRANHNLVTTLTYPNGFAKNGVKATVCQNWERCTAENESVATNPIFASVGYSYKENTSRSGLTSGFTLDRDALDEFVAFNPDADLVVSIFVVNPTYLGESFFEDGRVVVSGNKGVIQVDISELSYENYNYFISGFSLENMQNLELAFGLLVSDGTKTELVQKTYAQNEESAIKKTYTDNSGYTLSTVTVQSVAPQMVEALLPSNEGQE